MDSDDIVDALNRLAAAFERFEEKIDDLVFEAKQSNQLLEQIGDSSADLRRELAALSAIARREFDPFRK